MFECRLNQFVVEILQEYNAAIGLNNPPPTAQLLNAMASFVKQNTIKSLNLSVDEESATVKARAEFNDGKFAESTVDISFLKYELDAHELAKNLEGSDTVVVDINEAGNKVEIHLDSEVVAKIDRALLIPLRVNNPIELVGVDISKQQRNIPLSGEFKLGVDDTLILAIKRVNVRLDNVLFSDNNSRDSISFSFYYNADGAEAIKNSPFLLVSTALYNPNFGWEEYKIRQGFIPAGWRIIDDIVRIGYYDYENDVHDFFEIDGNTVVSDFEME